MSPARRGAVVLGILMLVLGAGLIGYFIGDHYATLAVADDQCPLYTDYSKPLCQGLQNRLDSDWWAMYVGDVLLPIGAITLFSASAKERPNSSSIRPPNASGLQPR